MPKCWLCSSPYEFKDCPNHTKDPEDIYGWKRKRIW